MIKNLIFDVGDVLIGYQWEKMLCEHGITEEDTKRIGPEMFQAKIWTEGLDAGYLTKEEAIKEYEKLFPEDAEAIAWFLRNAEKMVVHRPRIWKQLAALKEKGYRLYLLSNYSKELFAIHTKGADFFNYLDGSVISYQVHFVKPDRRIYEALLRKYDLKAQECLFFDDRADNVEAARKLGISAIQVLSEQMLEEELKELL